MWVRGKRAVGIEVKASARWREEYGRALADLHRAGVLTACYGVYLGDKPLQAGATTVLPLNAFLRRLTNGDVLR